MTFYETIKYGYRISTKKLRLDKDSRLRGKLNYLISVCETFGKYSFYFYQVKNCMKQHHLRNHCYFAVLLILILACCLSSCSEKDDIGLILGLVEKAEALAEEHDTGNLMDLTSKNFKAQDGKLKRQEVRKFLWLTFRRYGKFDLLFPEPAVEISDKEQSATAVVHFLIVKKEQPLPDLEKLYKDPERWLEEVGELADLYRLNLKFLKIDDKWLVTSAKIEPYRGFGFGK